MKKYIEISRKEFISRYSFPNDHVHLSAVALLNNSRNSSGIGTKGIDPIILFQNIDNPERPSKKFPGGGFEDINFADSFIKTDQLIEELKSFDFGQGQYIGTIKAMKEGDDNLFYKTSLGSDDIFFMMRKSLTLSFLRKTGYFVTLSEYPFFIDQGQNEEDDTKKSFRLFFKATRCIKSPFAKNVKKFYELERQSVVLLKPNEYLQIVDFQKKYDAQDKFKSASKIVLKEHLHKAFFSGYRRALVKFFESHP